MGNISALNDENTHVIIRMYEVKEPSGRQKSSRKRNSDSLTSAGFGLFEQLRKLRLEIAREEGMPPYIIFSDKALIEMCVMTPKNKNEMLNVSGVGANKFDKYGQRFLNEISNYQILHPNSVTSIHDDEEPEYEPNQPSISKRKKKGLDEFYLDEADAEKFRYANLYYISDIKEELNRVCSIPGVKKVTTAKIWEYLVSEDLTKEDSTDGETVKVKTEKGASLSIQTIDRVSQSGISYTLLMYPPAVQKMIVNHFIGLCPEV
jgi:ATP-dependent DNA helicase RecQ